jgi:hypothetical protein
MASRRGRGWRTNLLPLLVPAPRLGGSLMFISLTQVVHSCVFVLYLRIDRIYRGLHEALIENTFCIFQTEIKEINGFNFGSHTQSTVCLLGMIGRLSNFAV